jgi:hypothetical protein
VPPASRSLMSELLAVGCGEYLPPELAQSQR